MVYYIHNTSRTVENRLRRYESASHRGLLQFIGGVRIVRGRPVEVTEDFYIKHIDEISKAVKACVIKVCTPSGAEVDVATGVPKRAEKVAPLPNFVPDSVVNDPPSGIPTPIYPNGAVPSAVAQSMFAQDADSSEDEEEVESEHSDNRPQQQHRRKGRR